jgi:hypothetical protein
MNTYQFARDQGDQSKSYQDPLEALGRAEGTLLCRFDDAGTVKSIDALPLLRAFSRRCALGVVHFWDAPDIVRRYLETGDESLMDQAAKLATKWRAPNEETGFPAARSVWDACWKPRYPNDHSSEVTAFTFRAAWDSACAAGVEVATHSAAFRELVDAALAE